MNASTDTDVSKLAFSARDILDAPGLARRLLEQARPIDSFLYCRLTDAGKYALSQLNGSAPPGLTRVLVNEFNRIIAGEPIYEKARFEGVELRKNTIRGLRQNPEGQERIPLNRLLLEDVYTDELLHDSCNPETTFHEQGIKFSVYKVVRVHETKVTKSYLVCFRAGHRAVSRAAHTLQEVRDKLETWADEVQSGNPPPTKAEEMERKLKAALLDKILKKLEKIHVSCEEGVLEAIDDLIDARLKLGLGRNLLDFVIRALERLEKDLVPCRVTAAALRFKTHVLAKDITGKEKQHTIANVNRFAMDVPAIIVEREFQERVAGIELARREMLKDPLMTDILPNDIEAWLLKCAPLHRNRKKKRAHLVTFFKFCRDGLHALPAGYQTAATVVPVPQPPSDAVAVPVIILLSLDAWLILANLQDLDTVFFFALGIFTGLHQTEIYRLTWEDIQWDAPEGIKIQIAPGNSKGKRRNRRKRYLLARYPLDAILKLGQGRTGKIVQYKKKVANKIRPLTRRLKIKRAPSIMRKTFASHLLGCGVTEDVVARDMNDRVATVLTYYIAEMREAEAKLLWTLPVSIRHFKQLPRVRRYWDKQKPLQDLPKLRARLDRANGSCRPPAGHSVEAESSSSRNGHTRGFARANLISK